VSLNATMLFHNPPKILQRMTNNIGGTIPRFTISIEQDILELMILNIIFSVVSGQCRYLCFGAMMDVVTDAYSRSQITLPSKQFLLQN
jgi:hypothetical protein